MVNGLRKNFDPANYLAVHFLKAKDIDLRKRILSQHMQKYNVKLINARLNG